ncbi:Ribonuclease D [hydrothermal vent metagenome]|uniref:Ribonuclease D n=1 Tax=hydrothermal vent metagenome TaxID=652676 RepID=A0A3B0YV80_9ZZZZ
MPYHYISTQSEFDAYCTELNKQRSQDFGNYIALDTEFMRDKSYYSKLALLQICSQTEITLIDPLGLDMQPLSALLSNPEITKIFHAGTQDIEIFYNLFDKTPQNVFDTQIAATALGMGNQIGYADLVKRIIGKSLSKSHTRTNWLDRPLKPGPLEYAADDVIYLYELYPALCTQLDKLNRQHWLADDFNKLTDPAHYQINFDTLWRRVKGHQRLRGVQLAILDEIVRWRETLAIQKDRPRKFILKDEVLLDLARQKPDTINKCTEIRYFPKNIGPESLKELLQSINNGVKKPQQDWPSLPDFQKLSKHQEAIADTLMAIMKWAAAKNNISTDTLGTRKDIDYLVRQLESDNQSPLLEGWRYENVGCHLQDFLDGKASLHIKDSTLELMSNN